MYLYTVPVLYEDRIRNRHQAKLACLQNSTTYVFPRFADDDDLLVDYIAQVLYLYCTCTRIMQYIQVRCIVANCISTTSSSILVILVRTGTGTGAAVPGILYLECTCTVSRTIRLLIVSVKVRENTVKYTVVFYR